MEKPVEVIDYKGYQIKIFSDDCPLDPIEEFDFLGTMNCFARRHNIGHKHNYSDSKEMIIELAKEADPTVESRLEYWESGPGWSSIAGLAISVELSNRNQKDIIHKAINKHYIILPLYLLDHSGISISTGPFSCPWDSGHVGYIYVTKEKARKEYNWKYITKSRIETIKSYLKQEVKTYDQYLTGDTYSYVISNDDNDHIDSCGGFFGHDWKKNGLLEMAQNAIDCELRREFESLEFEKNCFAL
jgi:hypothetical protein